MSPCSKAVPRQSYLESTPLSLHISSSHGWNYTNLCTITYLVPSTGHLLDQVRETGSGQLPHDDVQVLWGQCIERDWHSWELTSYATGLIQNRAWYWVTWVLDIHHSVVSLKSTSTEHGVSGTVCILKLISCLLLPEWWWQLGPYTCQLSDCDHVKSLTEMPLVFSRVPGVTWGTIGSAPYFIHIKVEWLSNGWEGQNQGRHQGLFQGFEILLLSPIPLQRLDTLERLYYLSESHHPSLATSSCHPEFLYLYFQCVSGGFQDG